MQDSFHKKFDLLLPATVYITFILQLCASNQTLIGNHGNKTFVTLVVPLIWLTLNPPLRMVIV